MEILWIVLIVSTITAMLCSRYIERYSGVSLRYIRPDLIYFTFCLLVMIVVAGLRKGIGDTSVYRHAYNNLHTDFIRILLEYDMDPGFFAFSSFIKAFISDDSQVYIFICAALTIFLICFVLYKYSGDFGLAIFVFITMGTYINLMNGIRQYLAAAILFLIFPMIEERKLFKYMILVLIISLIHQSALIFLPLYFVVNNKAWGKITYTILGVGLFLYITYGVSGPIIVQLIGATQYSGYSEGLLSTDEGANIIRPIIAFVPVILSFIGKDVLMREEKHANVVINMNLLNAISMLLATNYWIYARFSLYFSLYSIILLVWCIKYMFRGKNKVLIYLLTIVLYGVFFWYENYNMNLIYVSDYIRI